MLYPTPDAQKLWDNKSVLLKKAANFMVICCAALEHQDNLPLASLPPFWSSSNPASKLLPEIFLNYKLHHITPCLQAYVEP